MELKNKNVLFLGSSVTYGSASGGVSFAEFMREILGLNVIKEAVSGTTLADISPLSYVSRLKNVNTDLDIALCICQLSTNDAWQRVEIKKTEEAIRFIVKYITDVFNCPILFYTGTRFINPHYRDMIDMLLELQKEMGFYILDLWNDPDMNNIDEELYKKYMADPVHPNLEGYEKWWTPKFIEKCHKI